MREASPTTPRYQIDEDGPGELLALQDLLRVTDLTDEELWTVIQLPIGQSFKLDGVWNIRRMR